MADDSPNAPRVPRREFIVRSVLYGGALAIPLDWSLAPAARAAQGGAGAVGAPEPRLSFDPDQWKLVEAITARILPSRPARPGRSGRPGRPARPGAREAGCVRFIDRALANEEARALPVYRAGLAGVEAVCARRHGKGFRALSDEEQDAVLRDLEDGTAAGWPEGPIPSPVFFGAIRAHTVMGFLADPRYGGNRDYVGWKLTRYPGPAHHHGGYTPAQMQGRAPLRAVWGEDL